MLVLHNKSRSFQDFIAAFPHFCTKEKIPRLWMKEVYFLGVNQEWQNHVT
jgi:hypothetical protein